MVPIKPIRFLDSREIALRGIFNALILVALIFGLWLATPSSLFFAPRAVSISGYEVTVARDFPLSGIFGAPFIRYTETVRDLTEFNYPCTENNFPGFQYSTDRYASWDIEEWAAPCMSGNYQWSAEWTVMLFGIIPLRPVTMTTIIRGNEE